MELLSWLLIGAIIGYIASTRRGFSPVAGILGGVLLGPVALAMFFVSGVTRGEANVKCPYCAEWVKAEAKVCKHCHRDMPTPQPTATHRGKLELVNGRYIRR